MLQEIYDGYKAHAAKEAKEERLIALHQKRLRKLENKDMHYRPEEEEK